MDSNNIISITAAAELISRFQNFVILAHASPDGDAVGSAYALSHALISLGKKVRFLCSDPVPERFSFLSTPDFCENCENTGENEFVISVDLATVELLEDLRDDFAEKIDLAVDHHSSHTFFAKNTLLEVAGANAEIVYKLITDGLKVALTSDIAAAIYVGITTDTGCFRFSNTSPQTHAIASELYKLDFGQDAINYTLFEMKTKKLLELEQYAVANMRFYFDSRCVILSLPKEILDGADPEDVGAVTSLPRRMCGSEIGITLKEKTAGLWKASVRTNASINASDICANFGGGGHKRAAGCKFRVNTAEECVSELLTVMNPMFRTCSHRNEC
ncbi:DHH family phosphoesterase [Clostridia bacterium]|nr:DHH family phosphoesterase [Clostridia bacterium]